jgi:Protein of unknown function (DUF1592)/Protein of unknown function (DUF1588)/Protein of unknown function (DUF1585)/Protein of unknown function (DUF1587)/Protein of unknown function (DUF1595)/Planctomycete cytochrome C
MHTRLVKSHCSGGRLGRFLVVVLGLLAFCSPAIAQPEVDKTKMSYDQTIQGLLRRYCFRCHDSSDPSAEVDLESDNDVAKIVANDQLWLRVREQVASESMPPESEGQPSDEDREAMVQFFDKVLAPKECGTSESSSDPGKPLARRLNRLEYNRTLSELLEIKVRQADDFPADPNSYGFQNNSESLEMDPVLVDRYYSAAEQILASLIQDRRKHPKAFQTVFGMKPDEVSVSREKVEQHLHDFATRAFRRPLAGDDPSLKRWMEVYDRAIKEGNDCAAAMKYPLTAILISPRFLIRIETDRPDTEDAYPVDDYDLASRLSYFLWAGPPDRELLDLAASGRLHEPEVLRKQVKRLLLDAKSDGLILGFFDSWLQLTELDSHSVDAESFPEFTPQLRESMKREVRHFSRDAIRENRSIMEFINSDYTFVDETLAAHYGVSEQFAKSGSTKSSSSGSMHRMQWKDGQRGGLLTSAAVLTLLSDPARTNVPKRGKFIAGTILGSPPPPPPPNVPELKAIDGNDQPMTNRQRLEKHREDPQCAGCHAKMDPLGFALENYDAIGRWRDQEYGIPVDASGQWLDGETFNGPQELKQVLAKHQEEFAKAFTESLLIYALGRGLTRDDRCVVEDAVESARKNDWRIHALIKSMVTSRPFTHRRNPDF